MGLRDSASSQLTCGLVIPLCLFVWLLFDLWAGAVYLPGPKRARLPLQPITDTAVVTGCAILKLGIAIGLFNWYLLANRPAYDNCVHYVHLVAVSISALGALALAWHMVVSMMEVFA